MRQGACVRPSLPSARLGRDLGHAERASEYEKRAAELRAAIGRVFGADIQGFHTYRYFVGHEGFRHGMGLPLAMGIPDRAEDTIAAMFSKPWMGDGLRLQDGMDLYWDRGAVFDVRVVREAGKVRVGVVAKGKPVVDALVEPGATVDVRFR